MAFDFEQLMSNPMFQVGLGLLGNANPRNAGFAQAAQQIAGMQKAKLDREMEKARLAAYQQQVETSQAALAAQRAQQEQQNKFMEQAANYLRAQGLGFGGQVPEPPQMEMPQQAPMEVPAGPGIQTSPVRQPQMDVQSLPPTSSLFREKIIPQESGGRQFRAPGIPLTSPKGAIGIAQIMPSTGPEAAALAGLPWDPNRLAQDPEYNLALGEAYFNRQLQDFGNPQHAAAAYNAGPNAVRRALDLADKAKRPDIWLSLLPKETQDYVAKTIGTQPVQSSAVPPPPSTPLGLSHKGVPLIVAGGMAEMAGVKGGQGLIDIGKAMEPRTVSPGSYQVGPTGEARYMPDPLGERRVQADEARVQLEQQRIQQDATKEQRLGVESMQKANTQFAKDKAAYDMVTSAADRMIKETESLLKHPGMDSITGLSSYTNPLAIRGGNAYEALAKLKTITSQLINDTLQSVRQASANGASGYGQFTERELEVIQSYVTNLDPGRKDFPQALQQVIRYAQEIKARSQNLYESSTGKSAIEGLPPGSKQIGTSGGVPVYEAPDGKRYKVQ